jgi:CHAT domain-containing protein/tetratricopeptide (TPR) repeat protein
MSFSRVTNVIFLCLIYFPFSIAQDHSPLLSAKDLYKEKAYRECGDLIDALLKDKTPYPDSIIAEAYKMRGDLHLKESDLKNTLLMYEEADKIYAKYENQFVHQRLVLANKSGICYAQQDKLDETAKYFQKEYDIAIQNYGPEDLTVGKSTNNLAAVYLYLGDFEKSLSYFFKSVEIKKKYEKENPIELANSYENISTIYGQINQMGEAEKYLQMAGLLYQKDSPKRAEALFPYYINMATFYIANEKVNEGLEELKKAEELPPSYKTNKLGELIHQKLYGDAYFKNKEYDKAMSYYEKAGAMIYDYDVGQKELGVMRTQMADIFAIRGEKQKAIQALAQADEEMLSLYGHTHKNYLNLLEQQIYIYLEIGELSLAQKSIVKYRRNFTLRNESLPNDLLFSNLKMGLLSLDLSYALSVFKESTNPEDLDKAISLAENVIIYQDEVLHNISDKDNRLYFFKNAYSNFSAAIYLFISKYNVASDIHFLEKAFVLSEKAKYYSMKEARGASFPILEDSVPQDLIINEKNLKLKLNQITSKYENKLNQKVESSEMLQLVDQIDSLKLLHNTAMEKLTEASPALSTFLNNESKLDINEAKSKLKSLDRIYISYFINENKLLPDNYAFILSADTLQYTAIAMKTDDISALVLKLNRALRLDLNAPNLESRLNEYREPAAQLHTVLIKSLGLANQTGIIINAHKELHSIQFDILLNVEEKEFLIQKRAVSYISALQPLLDFYRSDYDVDLILSAPDFKTSSDLSFLPLPNSRKEIGDVKSLLEPTDVVETHSKREFQKAVTNKDVNIVHLATHAKANQDRGYQSYLAFGNSTEDLLYSREIYGLPIYANLVVLSGCETGDGELVKSQGVLGLTSAFASTATQSIVASLWSANDLSSQEIMNYFYKALKSGMTKDEALREAKLTYISSVPPSKQHPYYWAGFIHYGNIEALNFKTFNYIPLLIGGLFGISVLMGVLWYRKKNKAALLS